MNETPKRLAPTQYTLIRLFARSGNQCAFPGCNNILIDEEDNFVGQVCHIEGVKGERFNQLMSNEERRSLDNLVLFCYPHHKKTDNVDKYSSDNLKEIKIAHEAQFDSDFKVSENVLITIYNELKEIKEDTSEILSYSQKNEEQQKNILTEMEGIKASLNAQLQPLPGFLREIEAIEELKKTKNYAIAIERFEKIKTEDWQKLSNVEKYKVTANIGLCYLSIQHITQAAAYLIEAVQYDLQNHKALAFAALGHAILKEPAQTNEFANRAIFLNPVSPYAYVALIMINEEKKDFDELLQLIPSDLLDNAEICFALGMALLRQDKYIESKEWFVKVLKQDEGVNFFLKGITAAVILKPFSDPFLLYSNQLSELNKLEIHKAIILLKEAWEEVEKTPSKEKGIWLLVNLSFAYRALNDLENAYYFLKLAMDNSGNEGNEGNLKWSYAVACFESNREEETITLLNQLIETGAIEDRFKAKLFLAEVHLKQRKFEKVALSLNLLLQSDLNYEILIGTRRMLVECHIQSGKFDLAKSVCSDMLANDSESLHGYILLAKTYRLENDLKNATFNLDKALERITLEDTKIIWQQIADEYLDLGNLPKAINVLEKITNTLLYTRLTKNLLRCYYQAGEVKKALALCESLTGTYGPINFLTQLRCNIYNSIDDAQSAIDTSLKHLEVYPDDQSIIVNLAFLYAQLKKWGEIDNLLQKCNLKEHLLEMDESYSLALLYINTGKIEKGLELAYNTRERNLTNANSHGKYFNLMLTQKMNINKYVSIDQVEVNSRVIIEWENKATNAYLILSNPQNNNPDQLSINSPLAKKLLRKRTGDKITHLWNDSKSESGVIKEIASKYIIAEGESLLLLQSQFKEESGFQTFKIGDTGDFFDDFRPLFDIIDKGHEHSVNAFKVYQQTGLTIGALSIGIDRSIIEMWSKCVSDKEMGVRSDYVYSLEELSQSRTQISSAKGVVVDIICLLTLSSLKLLKILELFHGKIIIATPCVDIIDSYIEKLQQQDGKENISVGKEGEVYLKHVTTQESLNSGIDHYGNLLMWISNHAEILPCTEALNINSIDKQKMDKVIGKATIDSILLAKEPGYVLLADETTIRSVANHNFKVRSASTYMILDYLYDLKMIDDVLFCEATAGLLSRNYKAFPISAQSLMITLKWSGYSVKAPFTCGLDCIAECKDDDSVIRVSAIFFHLLLNENIVENKVPIITAFLDRITMNRSVRQTIVKLNVLVLNYCSQNQKMAKLFEQVTINYGLKIGVF